MSIYIIKLSVMSLSQFLPHFFFLVYSLQIKILLFQYFLISYFLIPTVKKILEYYT